MRGIKYKLFYFLLPLLLGAKLNAQHTSIEAKIDLADILIGEQTSIFLTITTDKEKNVFWPIPNDFLMPGVEVLSVSKPDSSYVDNKLVIKQEVLITSFDSALYLLPSFRVVDQADTIFSDQVALKVSTVEVNLEQPEEFYDIKGVWEPPFVLADYYALIFGVLLTLFFICVIGYIIQRFKNRKKTEVAVENDMPKLPPYEEAMKELESIKQQKLWQQGREKEYHTRVTDALRNYITRRYGIHAMEMTSNEILDVMQCESDSQSILEALKQIFSLADYVKFAKLHPLPDENDLSMMNAYLFINQTKKTAPVEVQIEKDRVENKEKETSGSNLTVE